MTDTPLVVDALNFLTQYFMPVDEDAGSTPAWRLLATMKVGVEGFLKACAASGVSPHFVIDAGYKSDEASQKWTKRREKECRTGKRSIPLSADFPRRILREAGAPVYQVDGEDGDDIAAMLAYTLGDNSLILSGDRDMFRYVFIKDAPKRVKAADFSFEVLELGHGDHRLPSLHHAARQGRRGRQDPRRHARVRHPTLGRAHEQAQGGGG